MAITSRYSAGLDVIRAEVEAAGRAREIANPSPRVILAAQRRTMDYVAEAVARDKSGVFEIATSAPGEPSLSPEVRERLEEIRGKLRSLLPEEGVRIGRTQWDKDYLVGQLAWLADSQWEPRTFKPSPALVTKDGGSSSHYYGQEYDPDLYEVVADKWDHQHCAICLDSLYESDDPKTAQGYSDGSRWVCVECYAKLVLPYLIEGGITPANP